MITLNNVTFGYGAERVLNALSTTIAPNSICGLLGVNGSGKTTFLKLLAGLRFPSHGTVEVCGWQPRQRVPEFLQAVVLLPESFTLPPLTAQRYADVYGAFYPHFCPATLQHHLHEFELRPTTRLTRYSYGEQKKFLLAFALATGCRLLLLDEPTNGLDIMAKRQFRKLLAAHMTAERSVLIATHQVRDVEQLLDTALILHHGQIILNRTLADLARHLTVVQQRERPNPAEALYAEEHPLRGYTVLAPNIQGDEQQLDIELVFTAALHNPQGLAAALRQEVPNA